MLILTFYHALGSINSPPILKNKAQSVMTSTAKDQTSFSRSPISKSLWATAQVSTLTANRCPSFERYVTTFYHLSPFEVRSAASERWEGRTKDSSVLYLLKIWLLFRRGGKKDRSTGPPISKMDTPHETSQHDGSYCLYKLKRKSRFLKQRSWT